jgi:hypothetical protein
MWYESVGKLEYGPGIRAVVWVDNGIPILYRKLLPKYYYAQPQMYPPHITVVRLNLEKVTNLELWEKYQGEEIPFSYENEIRFDQRYFYLNVQSERIGDIREGLGLKRFRFGDLGAEKQCYHITIANVKHEGSKKKDV